MTPPRLTMMVLAAVRDASAPGDRLHGRLCDPENSKGGISATGENSATPMIAAALSGLRRGERNEMRGRVRQAGRLLLALTGACGRQGEANG